ncbi:MAG: protein kinase [Planctomycetota bacterium]|nr:protein kinase [Planctomycetota bacterium]
MATEPVPPQGSDAPTLLPGSAHAGDGKVGAEETIGLPGDDRRPRAPAIAIPPVRERTQTIGPYTLLRLLGRGGMGAVWEAHDTRLNRRVAVKVMVAGEDASANETERFKREAQNSAKLRHPNIVPVHDFGVERGRHYLVMDLVDGVMLGDALRQRQFTYREKAQLLEKVARAVQYAHEQGVIHRDLKPSNVMLEQKGGGISSFTAAEGTPPPASPQSAIANPQPLEPLVMDFGLAKDITQDSSLSQSGQVMGTPAYMSPEQAEGRTREVGPCSDVYSLGAILYEMLTGRPPFTGENVMQVLRATLTDDPVPPRQIAPGVPRDLETICLKCLHKRPERRYASAAALADDLKAWLNGEPISARPASLAERAIKRVRRNPAVYGVSAVALVVIVAVTVVFMVSLDAKRREAEANLVRFTAEKEAKERAEAERRREQKNSVPAFVESARMALSKKKLDDALAYLQVVLDCEPDNAPALMMKAQVFIVREDYAAATQVLRRYLELEPGNISVQKMAELSAKAKPGDSAYAAAFADIFMRQGYFYLAEGLTKDANKLLAAYRQRIDAAWSGMKVGGKLSITADGVFELDLTQCKQIANLSPLQDIPIASLMLGGCERLTDLAPLKGMPLTKLSISYCPQLTDLSPLSGLPLTRLNVTGTSVQDTWVVTGIQDLSVLKGMPLSELHIAYCTVRDISLLKGTSLTKLELDACGITDISALCGMPLTGLALDDNPLADLSALRGMPLRYLSLVRCPNLRDLSPLKNLPLKRLGINDSSVTDLTPLEGMTIQAISFTPGKITKGLEIVRRMESIKSICLGYDAWIPAAEFWRRYDTGEFNK